MYDEPIIPEFASDEEDLYCLKCGYNLRGLPGMVRRCPECGRLNELDPSRVDYAVVMRMEKRLHSRADLSLLAFLFFLLVGFLAAHLWSPVGLVFAVLAMVIWLALTSLATGGAEIADEVFRSVLRYQLWVGLLCAIVFLFILAVGLELPPMNRLADYQADPLAFAAVASFVVACLLIWALAIRPAKKRMTEHLNKAAQRMAEQWHHRRLRTPPEERGFF